MKNILITTLGYSTRENNLDYFVYTDKNDEKLYCTGISVAEAGTKYILSKNRIDEILVVANSTAVNEYDNTEPLPLKEAIIEKMSDLSKLSEYGFYQYRIQQFLDGLDIDLFEIIENSNEEVIKDFSIFKEWDLSEFSSMKSSLSKESYDYQCAVSYSKLNSRYKMYPLGVNEKVSIRFLPVIGNSIGQFEDEYEAIINNLLTMRNDDIKLYIDLQGFDFNEAFSLYNMISIYSESANNKVELAGVIQTSYDPKLPVNPIKNEWQRYEIQKLLTGVNIFLSYGKSSDICKYWNSRPNKTPSIDTLIEGIKYVDEGVTFCNIPIIRYGIDIIREAFKDGADIKDTSYVVMKSLIEKDYGALLSDESAGIPALLKWTVNKKMYQQALSIIESHIPGDLVDRGIFYYAKNPSDLEKVKKELNVSYWNESYKCRYVYNDIDHSMLKNYGRNFINNRQRKDMIERDLAAFNVRRIHDLRDDILPAYSDLNDDNLLLELLTAYLHIGNLRNQVCHALAPQTAGNHASAITPENNTELISTALHQFVNMYVAICNQMSNPNYVPVKLTGEDFHSYTASHQLAPFESYDGGILEQNCTCMYNGRDVLINIKMLAPEED